MKPFDPPIKVCAVSFLNTSPLVWGMLHGDQRGAFDLEFRIPSDCAREVETGAADIGIVPSVELSRHDYGRVPGLGIASHGAVRSILMVSSKPFERIQTLAGDVSSRTSVALARIILSRRYGTLPAVVSHKPDLDEMLKVADAALIIGDPALHLDPEKLGYHVLDLGTAWQDMTGLPMVFAIWAGRTQVINPQVEAVFRASYQFGRAHLNDIIRMEAAARGIPAALAHAYLTRHIVFELGADDYRGLELFLDYARQEQITAIV